jgi:hypothetical protein
MVVLISTFRLLIKMPGWNFIYSIITDITTNTLVFIGIAGTSSPYYDWIKLIPQNVNRLHMTASPQTIICLNQVERNILIQVLKCFQITVIKLMIFI